ncbi:hypothetical protein M404DRAFT_25387 [Pisolithus tinctorius Marx 270]|uniref:Uncharacterized protein n=1 Tax=Pisolithus tinctorius Marx 270 TaxID=870435 RepID=A0A0C3NXY7_PISTI|nr:hypothetical protein M404DRAFT_25387 [Pisolithus tinctorius Marx 270]
MSKSRPIIVTDNDNEGRVIIDWTQLPDDDIRYDTNDEEEVMKAKAKERKRRKVAGQAQQEEQARLEAERAAREKAEAKRTAQEAEEQRACKEEERRRAEEEKEAKRKCKAEAGKSSEAGAGGNETGKVRKVVMDPSCTCCAWANIVCEFIVDGNKKCIACKRKAEARPSNQKWVRMSVRPTEVLDLDELEAGGSGMKEAGTARYSGLENKLDLFELHETVVENLGCIFDMLELIPDESYGFGMAVSPSDSGLSELNSDELREEAEWLKNHSEDEEEESEGEDESMAEAE